jgi:hypothetical protein
MMISETKLLIILTGEELTESTPKLTISTASILKTYKNAAKNARVLC